MLRKDKGEKLVGLHRVSNLCLVAWGVVGFSPVKPYTPDHPLALGKPGHRSLYLEGPQSQSSFVVLVGLFSSLNRLRYFI